MSPPLRAQIIGLLAEREERSSTSAIPEIGEIATALGVPTRDVFRDLKASEVMGLVELVESYSDSIETKGVLLKGGAYVYLQSLGEG